jgi:VWFA-related protein
MAIVAGVMLRPSLRAQQSAPLPVEGVIRSQSNLVLVDAVVTGKHDRPVGDLKQSDFRVYQDGEEQPITSFSAPAENANAPTPQYLLLFFDATTASLTEQQRERTAAVAFVKKATQPNLYMAAEDYTGVTRLVQNFTTNRELMAKAVSEFKFGNSSANAGESATERFLFTLTDVCRSLGQVPGRKALVLLSGGYFIQHIWEDQLNATIEAANRANVTIYPIDTFGLSGGSVGANDRKGARGLSNRANTRNVESGLNNASVPPNNRNGTPDMGGSAPQSTTGEIGQELLETLANGTGGFTILNTNDFFRALSKVSDDLKENYTLGFVPPATERNERYHRIEVKVEGRGLKVRARDGYYEAQARDLLAGTSSGNTLLQEATSSKPGAISMAMSAPFFYVGSGKARVNVALQFPGKALHVEKSNGESRYQLNVLGIALRPDGSVAKRFSEGLGGSLDKEQEQKLAEQPFGYQSSFEIAPGQYRLVVVVNSGGSEFGKSTASLDITPYDNHSLGLSAIALTDQLQPVSPLLAGLKGQIIAQGDALVAGGFQIQPSATRAFPASRTVAFYVQVYEPALLSAHPPQVGILSQITDLKSNASVYNSGTMLINSAASPGSSVIPVAFTLPMNKLSAGHYLLRVLARDEFGNASTTRQCSFTVE